jgi:hypothetical protein
MILAYIYIVLCVQVYRHVSCAVCEVHVTAVLKWERVSLNVEVQWFAVEFYRNNPCFNSVWKVSVGLSWSILGGKSKEYET